MQFIVRVCRQAVQFIMIWMKRVLFRVIRGRRNCMLCALMVCFVYYWINAQFESVVEELTTPPPIDIHRKTLDNSADEHENLHIAVIGGYGSFAANIAAMMRLNSYHVLHVSPDGATISKSDQAALSGCLSKLNVTRSQTVCEDEDTVSNLLLCYGVNEVNFFYSNDDFTPFHSSRHIGATLCCYVAVLQASVGNDIAVKLYLQDSRTTSRIGIAWQNIRNHNMMKGFNTVQYQFEEQRSNGGQFELHDVLFHSLRSYLEMYRKLYNLQVKVFVN